jgi:hypothetical protein
MVPSHRATGAGAGAGAGAGSIITRADTEGISGCGFAVDTAIDAPGSSLSSLASQALKEEGMERVVFRTGAWRGIDLTNVSGATDYPLPFTSVWRVDNVQTSVL